MTAGRFICWWGANVLLHRNTYPSGRAQQLRGITLQKCVSVEHMDLRCPLHNITSLPSSGLLSLLVAGTLRLAFCRSPLSGEEQVEGEGQKHNMPANNELWTGDTSSTDWEYQQHTFLLFRTRIGRHNDFHRNSNSFSDFCGIFHSNALHIGRVVRMYPIPHKALDISSAQPQMGQVLYILSASVPWRHHCLMKV